LKICKNSNPKRQKTRFNGGLIVKLEKQIKKIDSKTQKPRFKKQKTRFKKQNKKKTIYWEVAAFRSPELRTKKSLYGSAITWA